MAKYVLFDTETTGNQEEDRIIQIGAMVVSNKQDTKIYDDLCSSEVPIKIEAMEVHNITPELIKGRGKFQDTKFYRDLNLLNSENNFLIAHNIKFDLGMLEKEGFKNRMQLIDTLRCSKHLFPESPYHRLQYFRYSLGLYKEELEEAKRHKIYIKAHDAISDVLVMKLLLSKLVARVKEKFPNIKNVNIMKKLVELTKQPVMLVEFRFGKYNGEKIDLIARKDMGYIKWMYKNMDLDEDMQFTLERIMEIYG